MGVFFGVKWINFLVVCREKVIYFICFFSFMFLIRVMIFLMVFVLWSGVLCVFSLRINWVCSGCVVFKYLVRVGRFFLLLSLMVVSVVEGEFFIFFFLNVGLWLIINWLLVVSYILNFEL